MKEHASPAAAAGALSGLRVIDLGRVLAGPLCAQMLGDHGAEVIKIEPPAGDDLRFFGPPFDELGDAAYFGAANRGKRSLSVDLSRPEGRDALHRLLERTDVLVENYVPGTLERWGLGYEALSQRHPRLILCSVNGFGADGPLGGLPGYDAVLQAICGLMSVNGEASTGPMRIGAPVVDLLTAHVALSGVLMALHVRERTGRGQHVEAALFDAALTLLVPYAANWLVSGRTPGLQGSAHANVSPYDKFEAGGGPLFLAIVNEGQFRRFCETVDRGDLLADPRFATNPLRVQHREALRAEIAATLARMPLDALCEQLMRNGVPAGPVNTVPQAFEQPHATHRQMLVERDGLRGIGLPIKLSATPGQPGGRAPRFGEHGREVLREAGFDDAQIDALRAAGGLHERMKR
ncbi:CaiB/BaiF CoA transferase family protein [Aquabacterium sp. J223]|uniref:CaiB/BaiF CoA transferase family protein n=1 Tax=Aquabacterium sp. J223 TaxID=2898431 RepID=UPI0021ADF690|nr:CoA transferase [Aquabacterium sp. J223]UUX97325.1 CoA transferase [Aquabacterium sp. J223]